MKSILIAAPLVAAIAFSGCAQVNEFIEKVDLNDIASKVSVQEVSVVNGITVLINGVSCNFSFTTNKEVVLTEVKKCMLNQLVFPMAMSSASGNASDNKPVVDEKEAELITKEIMEAIEK